MTQQQCGDVFLLSAPWPPYFASAFMNAGDAVIVDATGNEIVRFMLPTGVSMWFTSIAVDKYFTRATDVARSD